MYNTDVDTSTLIQGGNTVLVRFEHFSGYISAIYRSIQKLEREEMVKHGLTGAYAQYLAAIKRHPQGITCKELCEICDKDKAAVSRVISSMENKGLVTRKSQNNTSYRALLFLTEDGERAAQFISERAKIVPRRMSGNCAAHQRQVTVAIKRARQIALLPYVTD